jgi:TolB-like protein/Flp pilus assembly protein TadD
MRLTPKVIDTLVALLENKGHVVGKDELIQGIWPDSFVEESSLAQNICLLRKALAEHSGDQQFIETIPKRGYRFVAEAREIIGTNGEILAEEEKHSAESVNRSGQHMISAQPIPLTEGTQSQNLSEALSSLAILPFVNNSGDLDGEYLSDGITESLINNLSHLPQLRVTARTTVFRYKGSEMDPPKIGNRLGVRAVLTGRVIQRGDAMNIQAELVNVRDGTQVWGEQYTRSSSDIFEVQEQIANEITEKLRLKLSVEEKERLTKRYTENAKAYHLYLKGRYHWNKRTAESLEKGIECFEQAIQIDPTYALAYAGKSDCFAFLGDVGISAISSPEAFAKALEAAHEALKIDDMLAEAHLSLAHMKLHFFEWPEAEKEYRRALVLNPNLAYAHQWYAYYLLFQGRFDDALEEASLGLDLDPLSLAANADVGQILYYSRHYDAAIEQYQKALELEPNFYRQHLWLGWAYEQKRMYEAAAEEFQKARSLAEENTDALASLVCVYALAGYEGKARSAFAKLKKLSQQRYVSPYTLGCVYLSLGETEKAFASLEQAYDQRAEWMTYLGVDPRFDSVRSDSRFQELLRKIGFSTN